MSATAATPPNESTTSDQPAVPAPAADAAPAPTAAADTSPTTAAEADVAHTPEAAAVGEDATTPAAAGEDVSTPAAEGATPPAKTADLSPAACAAALAQHFPALFGAGVMLPVKLRIQTDIQQRAPGVFSRKSLSLFLHRHTTSTAYIRALLAATQRFDLDGQPAGDISEEHRAAAAVELDRRKAIVQERRAAQRQQQPRRNARDPAQRPPQAAQPQDADAAQAGMPTAAADAAAQPQPNPLPNPARPPRQPRPPNPGMQRRSQGPLGEGPRETQARPSPRGPGGDRGPRPQRPGGRDEPRGPRPDRGPRADTRGDTREGNWPRRDAGTAPAHAANHGMGPAQAPVMASTGDPVADAARRERSTLLRTFESSTLTKANFLVLKRMTEAELDTQLAQARQERQAAGGAPRDDKPGRR